MEENNINEEVVNDSEEVEFLDPVQPIEIEEGMPDDVKEAILRFNKRTSALRNVANNIDSSDEDDEIMEDEEDDDDEVSEEESVANDTSIIEDDNTEELGDLF